LCFFTNKLNMSRNNLSKRQIGMKLFLSTLYINSVAFGGGLVIIELLRKQYVDNYAWINDDEMTDIIAIAQSTPGAIAGNAAMIIGYRILGVTGAIISLFAVIIPTLIIICVLTIAYTKIKDNVIVSYLLKGMQAGAAAVILNLVYNMGKNLIKTKNVLIIVLIVSAFIAAFLFKINVPLIILMSACTGIIYTYYKAYKEGQKK